MNRLEYLIAQFGPRAARRSAQAMTLDEGELPGSGWVKLGDLCFRTGAYRFNGSSKANEEDLRAHQAKTFTVWRSFGIANASHLLDTQLVPYASPSDADAAAPRLRASWQVDPRRGSVLLNERKLEAHEVPDLPEYPFLYEQSLRGKHGDLVNRCVGGTAGNVVFLIACSGPNGGWPWTDVASVAQSQVRKIRRSVG